MAEKLNEVIEIENEETNVVDIDDCEVSEGGSGKVIAAVVAGVGLVAGVVAVGAKKLKARKAENEPKKKVKKRLRWVEVEDNVDESEAIDVESEEIEVEKADEE